MKLGNFERLINKSLSLTFTALYQIHLNEQYAKKKNIFDEGLPVCIFFTIPVFECVHHIYNRITKWFYQSGCKYRPGEISIRT